LALYCGASESTKSLMDRYFLPPFLYYLKFGVEIGRCFLEKCVLLSITIHKKRTYRTLFPKILFVFRHYTPFYGKYNYPLLIFLFLQKNKKPTVII
jgi:hypothetical protein